MSGKRFELNPVAFVLVLSVAELLGKVLGSILGWRSGDYDLVRYWVSPLSLFLLLWHAPIWVTYMLILRGIEKYITSTRLKLVVLVTVYCSVTWLCVWLNGWDFSNLNLVCGTLFFVTVLGALTFFVRPKRFKQLG